MKISGLFRNKEGYSILGYDNDGFKKDGFNKDGLDRKGYNRQGYDNNGYNRSGWDNKGYDKNGYNSDGYDNKGYDKNGYNKFGFNALGYNRQGKDTHGLSVKNKKQIKIAILLFSILTVIVVTFLGIHAYNSHQVQIKRMQVGYIENNVYYKNYYSVTINKEKWDVGLSKQNPPQQVICVNCSVKPLKNQNAAIPGINDLGVVVLQNDIILKQVFDDSIVIASSGENNYIYFELADIDSPVAISIASDNTILASYDITDDMRVFIDSTSKEIIEQIEDEKRIVAEEQAAEENRIQKERETGKNDPSSPYFDVKAQYEIYDGIIYPYDQIPVMSTVIIFMVYTGESELTLNLANEIVDDARKSYKVPTKYDLADMGYYYLWDSESSAAKYFPPSDYGIAHFHEGKKNLLCWFDVDRNKILTLLNGTETTRRTGY
jgi:hypothetical protein